jgi:succinate-semialdehyde dehydrogenase/glutarate-semialdehyde dehydrogenase
MTAPVDRASFLLSQQDIDRLVSHAVVSPGAARQTTYAPFTGDVLAELPTSTDADVASAFAMAANAQRAWAQRSPRERARVFLRFHDLVLERQSEGMDIAQWETGKARRDAFEELIDVALNARHYARRAPGLLRDKRRSGVFPALTSTVEVRHPKGVIGIISPWNYPLTLAASDAIPALMAGNAVVLKPDHQTTLTALWVLDVLRDAGLPDGLMCVVIGEGARLGPSVIDRADYVMFTGSTRVGREIARRCGERLIGSSFELGGKNAMIVRSDVDVERGTEIAIRACFANSGQLCVAMERIYVHADIADSFVPRFVERAQAMKLRGGVGWGADMGSLINEQQVERVRAHVEDAVGKGAEVLSGGQARPDIGPYFFEPTILTNVDASMQLCDEETFGPVVSVYVVRSDEEALELANMSPYGLNSAVLTRDTRAGLELGRRIRAGTVNVNEGYGAAWGSTAAPMGGMRDSGLGRRHGIEGLLKYTESQTIATQRLIGFGGIGGQSDEQWAGLLTNALRTLKRVGFR